MFKGEFGIAKGIDGAGFAVGAGAVDDAFANGSNGAAPPAGVVVAAGIGDGLAPGVGLLFKGLKGSLAALLAAGGIPPVFCEPGVGGKANGAGSTATGVDGDGGGEAIDEFAVSAKTDIAITTGKYIFRIETAP